MTRPAIPTKLFNTRCPSLPELRKSVKRKRNGAAPGYNSLTYVPYKKCVSILKFVAKLGAKIWKNRDIPADWAWAYIILLSQNSDVTNVSEFRPIATTSTVGKIFFSVLSVRVQFFMLDNGYISRYNHKGFLTGIAGCLKQTVI